MGKTTMSTVQPVLALDLEMNQPSEKVIQIGAIVGCLENKKVLERFNRYIKVDEKIHKDIVELTGIRDKTLEEKGVSLEQGYKELVELIKKWDTSPHALVWGAGDTEFLRRDLKKECPDENSQEFFGVEFPFSTRWLDLKVIYQFSCLRNGIPLRSGLAKSMKKIGMGFHGRQHNALDDAKNTFYFATILLNNLNLSELENGRELLLQQSKQECMERVSQYLSPLKESKDSFQKFCETYELENEEVNLWVEGTEIPSRRNLRKAIAFLEPERELEANGKFADELLFHLRDLQS